MKILVTGVNGLLGQKLVKLIGERGIHSLIGTGRGECRVPLHAGAHYIQLDVTVRDQVLEIIDKEKPDAVIHTAAMTNVDECETDREGCWKLNVEAVSHLIEACKTTGTHLIHVSTDFIFDGTEGPLDEDAVPNPVNFYGESKLAAEKLLLESDIRWSIARTILVYGIAHDMSRSNIILWVKKSLEEQKDIQVVDDQWRTPTLAEDLAEGCLLIAEKGKTGIFNISGKDMMTPYEMAMETARFFGLDASHITKTDGSKFRQTAKRPPRTDFIIDKARRELGYAPHSFTEGLSVLRDQLSS